MAVDTYCSDVITGPTTGHILKSWTEQDVVSVTQIKAAKPSEYQRYFKVLPTLSWDSMALSCDGRDFRMCP